MGCEDERLIQFLPWARRFARLCSAKLPSHLDHDDLQAAGLLGYLRAAARFNAGGGASFQGYCAVRIRGAVLDEVRRWDWAPRSVHHDHKRITRATLDLTENLEREPTQEEIARSLGLEHDELATLQANARLRQVVSFDEVAENGHGDDRLPLAERLADPNAAPPDARVRSEQDRRALVKCIARLPKTQAMVVVLHYLEGMPLRRVAGLLAVTPSRVSQLHRQALARLKLSWQITSRLI